MEISEQILFVIVTLVHLDITDVNGYNDMLYPKSLVENETNLNSDFRRHKGHLTSRYRRFLDDDGFIMGVPMSPSHLPRQDPILPGHTLMRPTFGMLKSSLRFPHVEHEGSAGVYGNAANLGLPYGGTQERVLYSGFRRSQDSVRDENSGEIKNFLNVARHLQSKGLPIKKGNMGFYLSKLSGGKSGFSPSGKSGFADKRNYADRYAYNTQSNVNNYYANSYKYAKPNKNEFNDRQEYLPVLQKLFTKLQLSRGNHMDYKSKVPLDVVVYTRRNLKEKSNRMGTFFIEDSQIEQLIDRPTADDTLAEIEANNP